MQEQLLSPLGWHEGIYVFNGHIECKVLEVVNTRHITLWIMNGQWEGLYDNAAHTMYIPDNDTQHDGVAPFWLVERGDNVTRYSKYQTPRTASEQAAEVLRKKNRKPCSGCDDFMGVECDGGWSCPGMY